LLIPSFTFLPYHHEKNDSPVAVIHPGNGSACISVPLDCLQLPPQASQSGAQATAADKAGVDKASKSLSGAIDKAAKKFDIKQAKAAQATGSLVALGALLAVGGLVLMLVTTGTASTIGLVALIVGLVVLLISVLS
jgi:hypothetical protein